MQHLKHVARESNIGLYDKGVKVCPMLTSLRTVFQINILTFWIVILCLHILKTEVYLNNI
jgi:hypothetical protein